MLSPDWFYANASVITLIINELQPAAIKPIARVISNHYKPEMTDDELAELLRRLEDHNERVKMLGYAQDDIVREVAKITKRAESEIKRVLRQAGLDNIKTDNVQYNAAGKRSLTLDPHFVGILNAAATRVITGGVDTRARAVSLRNLTGTTAINRMTDDLFYNTLNRAVGGVLTGTVSHTEALNVALNEMAKQGITHFDYATGRRLRPESIVLTQLRTSVFQATGQMTIEGMRQNGVEFLSLSAHFGARTTERAGRPWANHEKLQGKVYRIDWDKLNRIDKTP